MDIKIGGKKRKFKVGTNTTILFCEEMGIELADFAKVFQHPTGAETRALLWAGMKSAAMSDGKEFDIPIWQVGDWMDRLDPKELERVFNEVMKDYSAADYPEQKGRKEVK